MSSATVRSSVLARSVFNGSWRCISSMNPFRTTSPSMQWSAAWTEVMFNLVPAVPVPSQDLCGLLFGRVNMLKSNWLHVWHETIRDDLGIVNPELVRPLVLLVWNGAKWITQMDYYHLLSGETIRNTLKHPILSSSKSPFCISRCLWEREEMGVDARAPSVTWKWALPLVRMCYTHIAWESHKLNIT